jgi:hypothetical protein
MDHETRGKPLWQLRRSLRRARGRWRALCVAVLCLCSLRLSLPPLSSTMSGWARAAPGGLRPKATPATHLPLPPVDTVGRAGRVSCAAGACGSSRALLLPRRAPPLSLAAHGVLRPRRNCWEEYAERRAGR